MIRQRQNFPASSFISGS